MELNASLLDKIYDVPSGKSCWLDVLHGLQAEMQAVFATICVFKGKAQPEYIATLPEDDAFYDTYNELKLWLEYPWEHAMRQPGFTKNVMIRCEDMVDKEAFQQSVYYQKFWKKRHLGPTASGLIETSNQLTFIVGIPRHEDLPPYSDEEMKWLNFYVGHIRKAVELEGALGKSLPAAFYLNALSNRYELTAAESALLVQLTQSKNLAAAAKEMNRSYNTLKTQLAAIYRKTSTHSQAALMRKLFS